MNDWIERLVRAEGLPAAYATAVRDYVVPLAERIRAKHAAAGRPVVIGICGAQGSGKSTLALFLANWLTRELGLASIRLSLDDLYLGKQMRALLAQTVQPLLGTRGVPGTHDVELGRRVLAALTDAGTPTTVVLPLFDKAGDDRLHESHCPKVQAPVDVVLFEGWCVGARPQPQPDLAEPINALEANADPNGVWRRHVNERLGSDYEQLFERLDALILLRVPSFEKVYEWRCLQEHKLRESLRARPQAGAVDRGQSDAEIAQFVMYFERLTRHILATMPAYADTVIDIDDDHRMVAMEDRGWDAA